MASDIYTCQTIANYLQHSGDLYILLCHRGRPFSNFIFGSTAFVLSSLNFKWNDCPDLHILASQQIPNSRATMLDLKYLTKCFMRKEMHSTSLLDNKDTHNVFWWVSLYYKLNLFVWPHRAPLILAVNQLLLELHIVKPRDVACQSSIRMNLRV